MNYNWKIISIISIIILFLILFIFIIQDNKTTKINECETEYDCVPATCCHADNCISKFEAQNCTGILCSGNCQANTTDCGQAKCGCINEKCSLILNKK
jgi:hypothetical protein